jgi:hypothetical protein
LLEVLTVALPMFVSGKAQLPETSMVRTESILRIEEVISKMVGTWRKQQS